MEIQEVIYINRDSRKDRKKAMDGRLKGLSIPFARFKAHEGPVPLENTSNLNEPALACYYSHHLIYKLIQKAGKQHTLILEDDAVIGPGFKEAISKLTLPNDYDICHFGLYPASYYPEQPYDICSPQTEWLGHAYLVNKNCILRLIEATEAITSAIDHQLYSLQGEFNIYDIRPSLIVQDGSFSDLR